MKKILLLCVLLVACLAPVAEGAIWPVPINADTNDLKGDIETALGTVGPFDPGDTIAITLTNNAKAIVANHATLVGTTPTIPIPVPYHYTYTPTGEAEETTAEIRNITVTGGTIQAGGAWRLFDIAANGTATFTNVTLDGKDNTGGGVATAGNTTFTDVTFQNNKSAENGGAINASSGKVIFSGTNTFTGNQATENGGAIYIATNDITFNGTNNFDSNQAKAGGAVYSTQDISIPGGEFTKNQAMNGNGGAICSTKLVTLTATATFTGNDATNGSGGAIYSDGAVTVNGGTFGEDNNEHRNTADNNGGAICADSVTFSGTAATSFKGNQADNGGAIWSKKTVTMRTAGIPTFENNKADTNGGAIYTGGNLTVDGQTFNGNVADGADGGGAIYANAAGVTVNVTVEDGTFNDNKATNGNGGAIYSGGNVTVSGGTFGNTKANSAAKAAGGVIYAKNNIEITGGEFNRNTAKQGGVAYSLTGTVTISDAPMFGTLASNSATGKEEEGGGGVIYTSAGRVSISGGTFSNNKAGTDATTGHGGVVRAAAKVTITGGTFTTKNSATGNGGAIWSASEIETSTAEFSNQEADNGGALYAQTVTVKSGKFNNNSAKANDGAGGAIYAERIVQVDDGTFGETNATKNTAPKGGAIYAGTTATINGGEFNYNEATTSTGGAIHATTVNLNNTPEFTSNKAATNGGAIYATTVTLNNEPKFTSNTALYSGGAIYVEQDIEINGGDFYLNETTGTDVAGDQGVPGGGGAIYAGRNVLVTGGKFSTNTNANEDSDDSGGGAIYAVGDVEMSGGSFSSNTSKSAGVRAGGGAIRSVKAVTVTGGDFGGTKNLKNTATKGSGGAIYAVTSITVAPDENAVFVFSYQEANTGGALYSAGTIDATNTLFLHNNATVTDGGATYSTKESTFTNCFFTGNSAQFGGAVLSGGIGAQNCTWHDNNSTVRGGAVFVNNNHSKSSGNTIYNCVFNQNNAVTAGGAIYETGPNVKLDVRDSLFKDNRTTGTTATGGGAVATSDPVAALGLVRCTFYKNEARTAGNGGAANISATAFHILDCTFFENGTVGNGGALQLAKGTGGSAVVFNTIASNTATGNGGGICSTASFTFGANIIIDNGNDVYASDGAINSKGYNFFADYGQEGQPTKYNWYDMTHGRADIEEDKYNGNYKFDTFFEAKTRLAKNDNQHGGGTDMPPSIGVSSLITEDPRYETDMGSNGYVLGTLALREKTPGSSEPDNPAQVVVPLATARDIYDSIALTYRSTDKEYKYMDERGVKRPNKEGGKWDAGAYDTGAGENTNPDKPDDEVGIAYIRISGLPNTLRTVGQTTSLFAYGYDRHDNLLNRNVAVKWNSSKESVAKFVGDKSSGNIVIVGPGTTIIKASMTSASSITDSIELTVDEESAYSMQSTNFYPSKEVMGKLGIYLEELAPNGASLAFADADPASVTASSFQSTFKELWNVAASQITSLANASEVNFYSRPAKTDALKPGVNVAITGRTQGDVLPMEYTWTYSYDDLSKLMDRSVTTPPSAAELAKFMRIDFEAFSGATIPVVGSASAKSGAALSSAQAGVSAVDAALTEAFSIKGSSDGIVIRLTAYLANVQDMNNTGAQLVDRLLVVPDGVADNAISGTMWMSKNASSSSDNGNNDKDKSGNGNGGGGGGGCDAAGLGLTVLLLALPLLARRRR